MDREMRYHEVTCKQALNRLKRKMPYEWDMNIYRGCRHGCCYCYALYSNRYMHSGSFFNDVFIKTNIVEELEKKLRSRGWKKEVINIGSVTDSYQEIERQYRIMPEILKLLIKYKNPAIISTKSDLILRDYDLIDKLSHVTYINVASTITAADEALQRKIEPWASSTQERFEMLHAFSKTNASVGMHVMPVLPYLTDTRQNLEELYERAKEAGVGYAIIGTLNLRGDTKKAFFQFLEREYPFLYPRVLALFQDGHLDRGYKADFYVMAEEIKKKYGITSNFKRLMLEKDKNEEVRQLSLFEQ